MYIVDLDTVTTLIKVHTPRTHTGDDLNEPTLPRLASLSSNQPLLEAHLLGSEVINIICGYT